MVVLLIAGKLALVTALQFVPALAGIARPVDTGIIIAVAFVAGARFKDAGWLRWLGIALVVLITMVLPILILSVVDWTPDSENPLDGLPPQIWLSTAAFFALLIVAGIKPSAPVPGERPEIEPPAT
jgi:hypothetical protein